MPQTAPTAERDQLEVKTTKLNEKVSAMLGDINSLKALRDQLNADKSAAIAGGLNLK